jgi:peptide/nickel transport system substrate-binding protein
MDSRIQIHPSPLFEGRRRVLASMISATALIGSGARAQIVGDKTLTIATATEPNSFDPQFQYFGPNRQAHMPVFEPLVMYGPKLEITPALCTSWRSIGPTTWEINLRPGVRFHDGSPFSAEDVVFSLARAPAVPNSPSSMGVYTQSIAKIEVVDALKLLVHTKSAAPLLMFDLANVPILSKQISSNATTASFDAGSGVVGTGPFRFVQWAKGNRIRYEAFDNYWAGRSQWRNVDVLYKSDSNERVKLLQSGQVQIIDQVPPASIADLQSSKGINLFKTASNFLLYLHMDQVRPVTPYITDKQGRSISNPLLDVRVRKAMSMAIDRRTITTRILMDSATPANQLLPTAFEGTLPDLAEIPFAPQDARELLRAAGYPNGFRMVLHGTQGRYASDVAVLKAIAANLQQIGIDAEAVSLPSNEFFARSSTGNNGEPEFSVIQVGWASVEPSGALKGFLATSDKKSGFGSSNRGRYSNKKVDELLFRALETVDNRARADLLRSATNIAVVEDQGIVPLYFPSNIWAAAAGLKFAPRVDSSTFPMDIGGA